MAQFISGLQSLGRTLMLPIAVLPVAGLLLRFGQPDLLDIPFVAAAGASIFSNLGLLFAIGVAVGLARENHGAAGLAGVVCYFVSTSGAQALMTLPPDALVDVADNVRAIVEQELKAKQIAKLSVPVGILSGIISGLLYNRYYNIVVPEFLAFFGGRRFVPIAAGLTGVLLAGIFGFGWPVIEAAVDNFSRGVAGAGDVGLFIYGLLNRILIVTGLHHILNNVAWFIVGDFNGATGDLNRFFAGDPTAGSFMTGFFPVMMFGLPAACYAMYRAAPADRRAGVGGMYLSLGLTSFLTGVTEPIEFTFIFLAPLLYAIHAVLTGVSMVLMSILDVKIGFGFSAGLIDYLLNFNKSTNPLLMLPVGLVYGGVYYAVFSFAIRRLNLKTPGRGPVELAGAGPVSSGTAQGDMSQAQQYVLALGGTENIGAVDACTTRLRLTINDQDAVDEAALTRLGARGFIRPSAATLQVVLGPIADRVAGEMKEVLAAGPLVADRADKPVTIEAAADNESKEAGSHGLAPEFFDKLLSALGGAGNVANIKLLSSRLIVNLNAEPVAAEEQLRNMPVRAVNKTGDTQFHIIIGPEAAAVCRDLNEKLA